MANALAPTGPRRSSSWRAARCSSGASLALRAAGIEEIVVALPPGGSAPPGCVGVAGGATRSASVRSALRAARADPHVVVHDAARPLVTPAHFLDALAALEDADAAIAAAPMTDTVKEAGEDRRVTATLDRTRLWAIQTPQAFRREALERALDVDDAVLARGHRRRLAGRARRRHRAGGRVDGGELQGHDAARPARRRAAAGRARARVTRRLAVVGVAAGLLSGLLGIGGGIIIVPGLIWAAGLDRHTASGTSLVAILPIAIVAAVTYAVAPGGAFEPEASAVFVVGSLGGAVLGARVNARISERGLRMVFALVTGVFGLRLAIPLGFGPGSETLALDLPTILLLLALGLNGGFLAGLLGVGGGAIAIAVMVFALGTSQVLAQGIALVATIPTVIVGALQHRRQGTLAAREGLAVGVAGMATAIPGAFLAFALPVGLLRVLFGLFLIVSSVRILQTLRATRPEPIP